jgi:hypothetical protein
LNLPLGSHHSITSSARASNVGGTSMPRPGRLQIDHQVELCCLFDWQDRAQLFLAVLRSMSLHRLFSMPSGMNYVTPRSMSVVCRLFVMSSTVVLGGFLVVVGGMLEMF